MYLVEGPLDVYENPHYGRMRRRAVAEQFIPSGGRATFLPNQRHPNIRRSGSEAEGLHALGSLPHTSSTLSSLPPPSPPPSLKSPSPTQQFLLSPSALPRVPEGESKKEREKGFTKRYVKREGRESVWEREFLIDTLNT